MEQDTVESSSLTAALLSSLLNLNVHSVFDSQVLELYQLQMSRIRQRRVREMMERDKRRRHYLRRRRAFLLSSMSAVFSLITSTSRHVWVRNRNPGQNFWSEAKYFDNDQWKAQFRVNRTTFDYVLELIEPSIVRRKTNYRTPIEPRRRLAVTLWWFARSGEYRSIANMFGVGIATVCTIMRQVTSAIVDLLYKRFVSLPSGPRLDTTIQAFKDHSYPQCAGAIGTTHIPIAPPRNNPDDYINSSSWHSVILQAVVDHNSCFTDVYAGWPGSTSNVTVLSSSDLYLKAEDGPDGYLFPRDKSIMSDGVEVPVHLIGDTSFPLKPWLIKAYSQEHQLSSEQQHFTYTLNSARSVVNTAFTRLKGRWRCLLKKNDIDVSMLPRVIAACCILHNICEIRKDCFLPEWNIEMSSPGNFVQPDTDQYDGDAYCSAEVIRDTVTHNLHTILQC